MSGKPSQIVHTSPTGDARVEYAWDNLLMGYYYVVQVLDPTMGTWIDYENFARKEDAILSCDKK